MKRDVGADSNRARVIDVGAGSNRARVITAIVLIVLLLAVDQAIKVTVKTGMCLHESIRVADWFYITFIENNGMAWGMTIFSKTALTIFRILAVILIGYYLWIQVRCRARWIYIILLAMVVAGAAGNIIDCVVYGQVFEQSTPWHVASAVPFGQGYAPLLQGRVVDMLYFPIIDTTWPRWMPFVAGTRFVFFSPVFNFADACITGGFIALLLFCRRELANIRLSVNS